MIEITRDDQKVKVLLHSGVLNTKYIFTWNCNDAVYAELLRDAFEKKFGDEIERVRKEEYERGFKDARAKRARASWFKRWL